ncbi:MAG: ferredoxin family protein [Kiritimatiellae bacterium]|nr:ferredoxin family protein [Kiritimatiellia bacterium]
MSHVVTEPCIDCKNTMCVTVCPVNAFHEDERMLVIDPVECIDCGACVPECPTKAIFPMQRVPAQWKSYIKLNEEKAKVLPIITELKTPLS